MVKEYMNELLKNKKFMVCLIVTLVLAYGFYFTYTSVYIDDTAFSRYISNAQLLHQGRWGTYVIYRLLQFLGMKDYAPYMNKIGLAVNLFMASLAYGCLFKRESRHKMRDEVYTAFVCIFVSFSMVNELLFYNSFQLADTADYLLVAVAVWKLFKDDRKRSDWGIACVLLAFAIAIYEVAVVNFIVLVIIMMIVRSYYSVETTENVLKIIKTGIPLVIVLIAAIVLQRIGAYTIAAMLGWDVKMRSSLWMSGNVLVLLKGLISGFAVTYGVGAIFYLPLMEALIAGIVNVVLIVYNLIKKNYGKSFLWLMLGIGSVALHLAMGEVAANRSNQQVLALYVAAIFSYMLSLCFSKTAYTLGTKIGCAAISILVFAQAFDLYKWEYVNYVRDKEEKRVVCEIGSRLMREFDTEKPVVFVGKYQLSDYVKGYTHAAYDSEKYILGKKLFEKVPFTADYKPIYLDDYGYQYNETGAISIITWGVHAFAEINTELLNYFAMNGYVFEQGTEEMYLNARDEAVTMDSWPAEGAIKDNGAYIIVNFGI